MKCKLLLCSLLITVALFSVNAQAPLNAKNATTLSKAMHAGKITGRISCPKAFGAIDDFTNKVKNGTKLYAYKMVNGIPTDSTAITITKMTITKVPVTNSPSYQYDFTIEAVFPFDAPVDVTIDTWAYKQESGGSDYINFLKKSPSEYASLSLNDKSYEGFDFNCTSDHKVH
jgi:hypothetical protein